MKLFWFLTSSVARSDFESRWLEVPSKWAPPKAINRWVRSLSEEGETQFFGQESAFAAIEELWVAPQELDDIRDIMSTVQAGLSNALNGVLDINASVFYLVENMVVIDGDECITAPGIRQFALARRKVGTTHEEYVMHLKYIHGPLVKNSPALARYVQNRVVRDLNIGPYFDAFSEICFKHKADAEAFCKSDAYASEQVVEDGPKFVDLTSVRATTVDRQWQIF